MKECTFRPKISLPDGPYESRQNVFDMLTTTLASKKEIDVVTTADKEFKKHCTFQPNIRKKKTKYVQVNPLKITGYDEHVKKRRKVLSEREKRKNVLEKKIQSYSQQYDKRMKKRKKMLLQNSYAEIHKKNILRKKRKPELDEP